MTGIAEAASVEREAITAAKGAGVLNVLRANGYGFYVAALFFNILALQVQTVAVGWQIYDLTRNPMDLGLIGVSQFLPSLLLVMVTGSVADRFPRRLVMQISLLVQAGVTGTLLWMTWAGAIGRPEGVNAVLVLMAIYGTARAFYIPPRTALLANIVTRDHLARATAFNSSVNRFATIFGPVAGGLLYGLAPEAAYGVTLLSAVLASVLLIPVVENAGPRLARAAGLSAMTEGFRFVARKPLLLGVMSLDLFVVLVSGAISMLPVYARDILDVGAAGLGLLRAAPAVGAITVALWLTRRPVRTQSGQLMFAAVAVFCAATLVFGLSRNIAVSVVALAVVGAADMVSVVIRSTIVQLNVDDALRGRVSAIQQVFIGASNEVGAFRAGSMAVWLGPVASVGLGALFGLGICAAWTRLFPSLWRADSLQGANPITKDR